MKKLNKRTQFSNNTLMSFATCTSGSSSCNSSGQLCNCNYDPNPQKTVDRANLYDTVYNKVQSGLGR